MSEKKKPSSDKPKGSLAKPGEIIFWFVLTLAFGAFALFIMMVLKAWDPLKGTAFANPSIWEVFFAVFGLIYAIIVGLFIVESYRRWGQLSSIIHGEINAIGDIHDCLSYFDNSKKNLRAKIGITNELLNYVEIVENDWVRMEDPRKVPPKKERITWFQRVKQVREQQTATPKEKRVRAVFRGLRETPGDWWGTSRNWWATSRKEYRIKLFQDEGVRPIIEHVGKLKANGGSAGHALEVIIDRICEITTHRVNRLELAEHGLTAGLYGLIVFMSIVIGGATLLLNVEIDWVHGFIVFSTTVSLVVLGLLLTDLDHPFTGIFGIDKEILDDIEKKLKPNSEEKKD